MMTKKGKYWMLIVVAMMATYTTVGQDVKFYYLMRSDVVASGFYVESYLPKDVVMEVDSLTVRVMDEVGVGMPIEVGFVGLDDTVWLQADNKGQLRISQDFIDRECYDFFYARAEGYEPLKGWIHGYNINVTSIAENRAMRLVSVDLVMGKESPTNDYTDMYIISKKPIPMVTLLRMQKDVMVRKLSYRKWQPLERYDMVVGKWINEE